MCKIKKKTKQKKCIHHGLRDWAQITAIAASDSHITICLFWFAAPRKKYLHKKPLKLRFHGN